MICGSRPLPMDPPRGAPEIHRAALSVRPLTQPLALRQAEIQTLPALSQQRQVLPDECDVAPKRGASGGLARYPAWLLALP
jgi:hypothetical protein